MIEVHPGAEYAKRKFAKLVEEKLVSQEFVDALDEIALEKWGKVLYGLLEADYNALNEEIALLAQTVATLLSWNGANMGIVPTTTQARADSVKLAMELPTGQIAYYIKKKHLIGKWKKFKAEEIVPVDCDTNNDKIRNFLLGEFDD